MIGTIIKGIGGFYYIKCNSEIIECKARGKFRHNELTPLVGDKVEITVKDNKGVIERILPRISELARPNVANVTQAFIVFAVKNPDINYDLLNKFLVLCESKDLNVIVCINKAELAEDTEKEFIESFFRYTGYEHHFIEAKYGKGIDIIKERLKDNVSVVCGPSGAGKSTLINKVCGIKMMETGEISDKLKRGKHTTRHSELIETNEGYIVDTPGFSSLDITHIKKEELQNCFPEFNQYLDQCKFSGCIHNKEPKCAVKDAVEKNLINEYRYKSYITLLEEIMSIRQYD